MSLDAGTIHSAAELDVSQVDAATARLVQDIERVNTAFSSVRTPRLTVDDTQARQSLTNSSALLDTIFGKLSAIPVGKIGIDVSQAETAARTLNQGLSNLTAGLVGTSGALGPLTAGASAGAGVMLALAAAATQAALEFRGLERQLVNLTGASGDTADQMRRDFDALFRSVPADGGDLVRAQARLQQEFGTTGAAAQAIIADLNAFTRVIGGDLTENTRGAVDVFTAWQVATEDQQQTLNDLARAIQFTGADSRELFAELSRGAASFQALGLNIKEGAVALDAFHDAGLPTRAIISSLRNAQNELAHSGVETDQFFRDTVTALKNMTDETEAATRADVAFGKGFGTTVLQLIRQGRLDFDELTERIETSGSALEGNFARGRLASDQLKLALNTLRKEMQPLGEGILTVSASLATDFVGAVHAATTATAAFMNSGAVQAFLALQKQLGGAGGVATAAAASLVPGAAPLVTGAQAIGARAGGAGEADTTDAINRQSQANTRAADIEEKRAKTLHSVAEATANFNAATQAATKSLEEQIKAAAEAGNTGLIAQLLDSRDAVKTLGEALSTLTDHQLAASIAAMAAQGEVLGKATGDWSQYDAAVAFAGDHLAAQKASQEESTRAVREAQKILDDVGEAYRKAGQVAEAEYGARVQKLADAILPNLDVATATTLKQQLLLNDQLGALATISAATGIPIADLAQQLGDSGARFDEFAKQTAATSRNLDDFVSDEKKSRIAGVLGGLASLTDASTAALAKQKEQAGDTAGALQLLLQAAGVGASGFAAIKTALEAGGAAAFAAQEQIKALTTFVRDQGTIRLKIDVDIENTSRQIAQLQTSFREANAQRARTEATAQREFQLQEVQAQKNFGDASREYSNAVFAINQAHEASARQLQSDLASASSAANKAARSISDQQQVAASNLQSAIVDAQVSYAAAIITAQETYSKGLRDLTAQSTEAMEVAARRQGDLLRQAGQQATAQMLAQLSSINQQSIALEDLRAKQLLGGTQADQNDLATQLVRLTATQGFANAQAALSQQQARDRLAQEQLQATKDATKQQQDLAKALQKLSDTLANAQTQAAVDRQNALTGANTTFGRAQIGDAAFGATNQRAITLLRGRDGQLFRVESNVPLQAPEGLQAGGFAGAQRDALRIAEEARNQAFSASDERERKLREQLAEEQRKFQDKLLADALERAGDPEGKGRTRQQQQFDEQERQRREDQRKADKDFLDQQHKLAEQLDELKRIHTSIEKLRGKIQPQVENNFAFQKVVNQETGVDFLAAAARALLTSASGGL